MKWQIGFILIFVFSFWRLLGCVTAPMALPPESITTWIIGPSGLTHHTSAAEQTRNFTQAANYRCYSPEDDLAWRDRMSTLENRSGGL